VKFGQWEIGEIVRSLPDKNNLAWLSSCRCFADRAQNLSVPDPFHPNQFTFGGVIAERVNTAKTRRKVNPIFG